MPRKTDLEDSIKESYSIIREYEAIIRTSDRPEEKMRARRMIRTQRPLIEKYADEYRALGGNELPKEIADIVSYVSALSVDRGRWEEIEFLTGLGFLRVGLILVSLLLAIAFIWLMMYTPAPAPSPAPTPAPSPAPTFTPLLFVPASENQTLIIVADFEDRSKGKYSGIDAAQYIYDKLVGKVEREYILIRRLRQVVDSNTVKSVGQRYNAELVVWGWYDALTITPYIDRINTMPEHVSSEEDHHFRLPDLEEIGLGDTVVDCLPSKVTYLIFLIFGISEYTHQDYDLALESLDNALTLASASDKKCPITPGEVHFYLGNVYYRTQDYEKALTEYTDAVILENAKVYNNRGNTYHMKGEYQQAVADFDKAVELEPNYGNAYFNRGNSHFELGNYKEALADYTQAITLSAEYALFFNNRGNAYYKEGHCDDALADYERAIELDPEYAEAYYNRSVIYYSQQKDDLALADCSKAIDLTPDNAAFYHLCGSILMYMGKLQGALENLNKAAELDPQSTEVYCSRGETYKALDQQEKAIADLEHCIEETNDPYWQQVAQQDLKELSGE
ncbi:MAG: tetratricopeptide repeat protein [Anaerolineae bacterium]|jgi:tetratricopeptide (TPR) repeat protein